MNKLAMDPGDDESLDDDKGLEELEVEELTGVEDDDSLEVSETDDEEDEGVGDGNMTRGNNDPFKRR